jgi:hypothetical protein
MFFCSERLPIWGDRSGRTNEATSDRIVLRLRVRQLPVSVLH